MGGRIRDGIPYHRDITDAYSRIYAIDASNPNYNIVNKIFENAGDSRQTGVRREQQVTSPWRVSGSVNVFRNEIDAFETILLFPQRRPFALDASTVGTWDATVNNRFRMPRLGELNLNYVYYAKRNVPQGRQRSRSSLDVAASGRC